MDEILKGIYTWPDYGLLWISTLKGLIWMIDLSFFY